MKRIILITAILMSSMLETALFSLPFSVYLVVLLCILEVRMPYFWSFVAGFMIDITAFRLIGVSSLIFTLGCFLWIRFSQKIQSSSFFYRGIFLVFLVFFYDGAINRGISAGYYIRDFIAGLAILFVFCRIVPPFKKETKLDVF